MSEAATRPSCRATNRAGGPCGSVAVLPSGYCCVHDADHRVSKLFGSGPEHTTGYQLPAKPRTLAVLAELVEQQMETVVAPYLEGLNAVVMIETDGEWVTHPDWPTRLKAAETLLDRTSGKPKQAVDVDHTSGGKTLEQLFAPSPLGQAHSELPVDEPQGWEGTDG